MSKHWKDLPLPHFERVNIDEWLPTWLTDKPREEAKEDVFSCILTPAQEAAGVKVLSFEEAQKTHAESFKEVYGQFIPSNSNQLTGFHQEAKPEQIFIYIPPHTNLEEPLELHVQPQRAEQEVVFAHLVLFIGSNSHVELIEYLETDPKVQSPHHLVYLSETLVRDGAHVNYAAQETLAKGTRNYVQRASHVEADAHLEWALASLNDGHLLSEVNTRLIGKGAEALIGMIGISTETTEQIVQTNLINDAPHTQGHIIQHGVILDQARLSLNSVGKIERFAKQADAQQESRILMLTEEARGDANPILLIEEYEVTAGHAASVGQVDEEQLYYLMSRGIHRAYAEYLVIRGFLGPVMVSMPTKAIQDQLVSQIDHKLASLLQ